MGSKERECRKKEVYVNMERDRGDGEGKERVKSGMCKGRERIPARTTYLSRSNLDCIRNHKRRHLLLQRLDFCYGDYELAR
jgi:hypothetical protein